MTTVQLFYGHVASNWGDLAINAGVIDQLKRCGVDLEGSSAVVHWPTDAFLTAGLDSLTGLGVRTFPPDGTPRGTKEEIDLLIHYLAEPRRFAEDVGMSDHDVIVLNAGEHFFESAKGENIPDLLWRALPAIAAIEAGKPVIMMPSTVGPFRTALGSEIESLLAEALTASAFREERSRQLGDRSADSHRPVLLDPGFFVPSLNRSADVAREGRTLGIVVRLEDAGIRSGSRRTAFVQQKFRGSSFQDSQAFRLFSTIAEEQLENGGDVRIIVQTRADRELSWALFEHLQELGHSDRLSFVDPVDFETYLSELHRLDRLVTSRFHAVILGVSQGVPSLGVYSATHGHKMPGLFTFLKVPFGAVRLDDRDVAVVHGEVRSAMAELEDVNGTLQTRIRANRTVANKWLREAMQLGAPPATDLNRLKLLALRELYGVGVKRARSAAQREVRSLVRATLAAAHAEDRAQSGGAEDGTESACVDSSEPDQHASSDESQGETSGSVPQG